MNKDDLATYELLSSDKEHSFHKIQKELDKLSADTLGAGVARRTYDTTLAERNNELLLIIAKQLQGIWGDMP